MPLAITETADGVTIPVKVVPGASRSRVMGELGDALKVAVSQPPSGGAANKAVVALIASVLGVAAGGVQIVAGTSSPRKRVFVAGLTAAQVRERLAGPSPRG
jgi:uncharacterized protein (TIGR00251 family)